MKAKIRQSLLKTGAWYPLMEMRSVPQILSWIAGGSLSPPPHAVKMRTIRAYLRRFSIAHFLETGTYFGDTLEYIAGTGVECTSIELSEDLFAAAKLRVQHYNNVTLILGDSSLYLPTYLQTLDDAALFWLDGHYSGGVTARGEVSTPISIELQSILEHRVATHVILIDDARLFDGSDDYPLLEDLLQTIRGSGKYEVEISTDIIRLTPKYAS